MELQQKIIEALYAKFPGEPQASIARHCGLTPARFNNYAQGIRTMDVDAVIGCAQALGWDIRATVSEHLAETAGSKREKGFWKEVGALCAVAGGVLLGALVYGHPEEWAIVKLILGHGGITPADQWLAALPLAAITLDPVCIMRNAVLLGMTAFLMHHLLANNRRSDP